MNQSIEISTILLNARNGHDAFRKLFYYTQSEYPQYSLVYITKHTSIKSKGYLSEVLSGKKLLKLAFVEEIANLFKLSPAQSNVFSSLWQLDHSEGDDLLAAKESLEKALRILSFHLGSTTAHFGSQFYIAVEVYSYMNMKTEGISISSLLKIFQKYDQRSLEIALSEMLKTGLLVNKSGQIFSSRKDFIFTDADAGKQPFVSFLKRSAIDAAESIEKFYNKNSMSHFESIVITTNRKELAQNLPKLRHQLIALQEQLDSKEPDMLIRFNFQLFPVLDES